jgi:hypothetical protein
MLPDNTSRTWRLQHAHRGEANRGAVGIEVQSNRGYPVEDLVIGIIILNRCNSDTARKTQPAGVGEGPDLATVKGAPGMTMGLISKRRQATVLIFRPAIFNRHVLAVDIAAFFEALDR